MPREPIYINIYENYKNMILEGKLKRGDKVPTEKEISRIYNVSRITSQKAMDLLRDEGYLERVPRRGTFVTATQVENGPDCAKYRNIGLAMPDIDQVFGIDFLKGVQYQAKIKNYGLLLGSTYVTQDEEYLSIERLTENGALGIIWMPVCSDSHNLQILKNTLTNYPMVLADRELTGISVPAVCSDNETASTELMQYLFSIGHSKIAFVGTSTDSTVVNNRLNGFIKAYANNGTGLEPGRIITNIKSTMPGMDRKEFVDRDISILQKFIENNPDITAVFASTYNIAKLVEYAIKKLKLRVPEDISIVCFDSPESPIVKQFFTHVRQNEFEMGTEAARTLIDIIEGREVPQKTYIETKLIIGRSCKKIFEVEKIRRGMEDEQEAAL